MLEKCGNERKEKKSLVGERKEEKQQNPHALML